jgi:hypothetical protein
MIAMVGSIGLALLGCTDPTTGGDEPENGARGGAEIVAAGEPAPIFQLDLGAGHTVKFYEPSPGALFVAEQMVSGQPGILSQLDHVDAVDLFTTLRPNEPVPAALSDAHARAIAAVATLPASTTHLLLSQAGGGAPAGSLLPVVAPSAGPGLGTTQQALTSSADPDHFVNTDHGCDWANGFSFCRIHWGNGMFVDSGSTDSGICIVDHYAGNGITVQLTADTTTLPLAQAVGTEVSYSWGIVSGDVHRRMDILNASGDSFHAGCRFSD